MSNTKEVRLAATALCLFKTYHLIQDNKKKRRQRRRWMTAVNRSRNWHGMEKMIMEMVFEPPGAFHNFTRMSLAEFEFLLSKVEPIIAKQNASFRDAVPAKFRLATALRYLATGVSYKSLHFLFKVSASFISQIIPEVHKALNAVLMDDIMMPRSTQEWLAMEEGFQKTFPHCIEALDGKHIVITCPANIGSDF